MLRNGPTGPVLLETAARRRRGRGRRRRVSTTRRRAAYRSAGDPGDVAEAVRLLLGARAPAAPRRPRRALGRGLGRAARAGRAGPGAGDDDDGRQERLPRGPPALGRHRRPHDHPRRRALPGQAPTSSSAIGCSFAASDFSAPIPAGKTIVQITVNPSDIDKDYPTDLAVARRRQAGAAPADRRGQAARPARSGAPARRAGRRRDPRRRARPSAQEWRRG